MLRRAAVLLALVFCFVPGARAKSDVEQRVDGTTLSNTTEALARSRYSRRERAVALTALRETITADRGNLAVIEDDGTIISPSNLLDLSNRSVIFTPVSASQYSVVAQTGVFDDGTTAGRITLPLTDDDTARVSLPFSFVMYGIPYDSVFVNTDGNLTFTIGDNASTDRNLSRVIQGPPRISPLFDDLNPASTGRISVEQFPDRVLFTWTAVGEFTSAGSSGQNTFQVVLSANGTIQFNYRRLDAGDAVSGLPRKSSGCFDLACGLFKHYDACAFSRLIAEIFATQQALDLVSISQTFYRTHPDEYDGLVVFSDFPLDLNDAFAYALPLRNSVRGISNVGPGIFDFGRDFGSPQRLSVVVNMGDIGRYPSDPESTFLFSNNSLSILGQEFGHRWLAFLELGTPQLLGRDQSHWSFLNHTSGSVMEGNDIEDLGQGAFRTGVATVRYSPLDQYVMGLRAASEVPPWFVVTNPTVSGNLPLGFPTSCRSLTNLPACPPFAGVQISGTRRNVTIDDIVSLVGPRIPGAEQAQKDFRVGFILITRRSATPEIPH
jgi:hypothetical protein